MGDIFQRRSFLPWILGVADQRPGAWRRRWGWGVFPPLPAEAFCGWVTAAQHNRGLLFKEGSLVFARSGRCSPNGRGPTGDCRQGSGLPSPGPRASGRPGLWPGHRARPWGYGSGGRKNSLVLWRLPGEWGRQAVIK